MTCYSMTQIINKFTIILFYILFYIYFKITFEFLCKKFTNFYNAF